MIDQQKPSSVETTRSRIIAAAAEIGSQVGYTKATTKAIADAAGVNEVTLFRHFGSKGNLFSAAVEEYGGPALAPLIEAQFSGDYGDDLLMLGKFFLDILVGRREVLRLLLCESAHIPEVRTVLARNPRELRQMLSRYLKKQMDLGVIIPGHPEAMAQAFLGMFFSYAISLNILEESISPDIDADELVSQFVEIFISGTVVQ
jgi:AcrR family transcriptional regulator